MSPPPHRAGGPGESLRAPALPPVETSAPVPVDRDTDDEHPVATAQRRRPAGTRWLRSWASTLALVAAWQLVAALEVVSPAVLPAPSALVATAVELLAEGTLLEALGVSFARVAGGCLLGIGTGLLLGLLAGFFRTGADLVDRPLQALRTIPFTALTPLLIVWFGFGETPKVLLVAIATVVPTYLNTFSGVRGVDPKLLEVAAVNELSWTRTVARVLLPGASPTILTGVRHALGIAWVAVIVAETVNASAGLGHLLTQARTYGRTDIVMVCIAVYAALGLTTDSLVRALERRLLRWQAPGQSR